MALFAWRDDTRRLQDLSAATATAGVSAWLDGRAEPVRDAETGNQP